jgi:type 1 glutamine amidotransferase
VQTDKHALIVWGGWDGHQPEAVAAIFARELQACGFGVRVETSLDCLRDEAALRSLNLIVPVWTMGTIEDGQLQPLLRAVEGGVGLAGCHGGLCDAFREACDYQFMTGGQWVAHPGGDGVRHTVRITNPDHFITAGLPASFEMETEQYYLHVDPANRVLAVTAFPTVDGPHAANGPVDMPVAWTKYYGRGRVFYCSLGHHAEVIEQPEVLRICRRGLLWAAGVESDPRERAEKAGQA